MIVGEEDYPLVELVRVMKEMVILEEEGRMGKEVVAEREKEGEKEEKEEKEEEEEEVEEEEEGEREEEEEEEEEGIGSIKRYITARLFYT